jgi:Fungal protein kinase
MTEEELDLDTFIHQEGQHSSVAVVNATTGEDVTLDLKASPFIIQRAIISRGTFCYRTTDQRYVVKFS